MEHTEHHVVSSKNKTIGILFLTVPILTIIATIISFAFVNTLLKGLGVESDSGSLRELVLKVVNFVLGLLGLIAVIALIVGIPVGIIFLNKKTVSPHHYDERSGKGDESEVPDEIAGWSWGAFGLTWIWGVANRVWISLLMFVPFVSIVMWFILGVKGNEWAWRKNRWASVEQFKKTQRKWMPWGISFFVLRILLVVVPFIFGMWLSNSATTSLPQQASGVFQEEFIAGKKVNYKIRYDQNTWLLEKNQPGEAAEFTFQHRDGDVYASVIPERIEVPLDALKNVALENAKAIAPDIRIIYEEKRKMNGKDILVMKMQGTASGILFAFYGYYYSGDVGSIQFVSWTSPKLLTQYEKDINDLLNGLQL